MTKLKARHFTQAARPQGRVIVVAIVISVVWLVASALAH
ncbi:cell division protein FtsN [Neorhizobium galegae]|jgi:hypothetical protein|nr:cell division protein FtsN [Neorhizobium galegae]